MTFCSLKKKPADTHLPHAAGEADTAIILMPETPAVWAKPRETSYNYRVFQCLNIAFVILILSPVFIPFLPLKKKNLVAPNFPNAGVEVDTTIALIPEKLEVRIKTHEVSYNDRTIQCLSYVTQGLAPLGQRELVLTLEFKNDLPEPYPKTPFDFFITVHHLASEGRIVEEGGRSEFTDTFLNRKAAIYIKGPSEIQGLNTPQDYLSVILITNKELEAYNQYGYLRILSLLGNVYRYYPTPFWNDISRKELPLSSVNENSILNNVNCLWLTKSTVTQIGNQIHLKMAKDIPMLEEKPPTSMPVAILPSLDMSADACYVWNPDQLMVITPYTDVAQITKTGGCFVALVAEQESAFIRIIEDGFGIFMTNKQWKKFWKAYDKRQPFSIELPGESLSFSLEWVEQINEKEKVPFTDFYNPFDQKTYSGQWEGVDPIESTSTDDEKVRVEYIRMITDNGTVSENIDATELGYYAGLISNEVSTIPSDEIEGSGRFIVQVTLSSASEPEVRLVYEKTLSADNYFQKVKEKVNALEGLNTKKENIVFHVNFIVNP